MSRLPQPRTPHWLVAASLVLCLLAAQAVLLLHRVAHGVAPSAAITHADAAKAGSPIEALFGHAAGGADCLNFDHAFGGDSAPLAVQPATFPPASLLQAWSTSPCPLPQHAAHFDARGPPGRS